MTARRGFTALELLMAATIGSVVLLAALGVFGTGSAWPDLTVAIIMASLAVTAAVQILLHAQEELDGDALGHKH